MVRKTKKYNRIKSHLVLKTKKLTPREKRYCSCLMKVRSKKVRNPYGICTAAGYNKQGLVRDKQITCSKYYDLSRYPLRIHADTKVARVQIDFQQKDPEIRSLFFEQFKELKNIFHSTQNEEWNWEENYTSEFGIEWSRVYIELENVNIYNKENWQEIFEFFEGKLLKFDEFWNEFFELFKQLED